MLKQGLTDAVSTRFFMPSPALKPYVSTYYLTEFAIRPGEPISDWLHPEWGNVRLSETPAWRFAIGGKDYEGLGQAIGTGPTSQATHFMIEAPTRVWGIGILPLGWLRLVDTPAQRLADLTIDCEAQSPFGDFSDLHTALFNGKVDPHAEAARIDGYLLDLLERRPRHEDEERIRLAHAALIDDNIASVGELAERIGTSSRSLERLSLRAFGFSPKLLLRRQRFLRSLSQFMLDPSLTWIRTLDYQYVDQAHFVRDFKRFMTMSPSTYAALDHPVLRSAARARAVAAGAAVQALHKP
ncbi:MAG: helix-turn-helix domain-containing protein [Novosphingobium sp.]